MIADNCRLSPGCECCIRLCKGNNSCRTLAYVLSETFQGTSVLSAMGQPMGQACPTVVRAHTLYSTVDGSRQGYSRRVGEKKIKNKIYL